jgi:hypothetical protein
LAVDAHRAAQYFAATGVIPVLSVHRVRRILQKKNEKPPLYFSIIGEGYQGEQVIVSMCQEGDARLGVVFPK